MCRVRGGSVAAVVRALYGGAPQDASGTPSPLWAITPAASLHLGRGGNVEYFRVLLLI